MWDIWQSAFSDGELGEVNRVDLQRLSEIRLKEARVLLEQGFFDGAYYLLGYAVECALKSCIARQFRQYDFPDKKLVIDSYTHELEKLLSVSGLKKKLETELKNNPVMEFNWGVVKDWSEKSRYQYGKEKIESLDFYNAVTEEGTGILSWLKNWW